MLLGLSYASGIIFTNNERLTLFYSIGTFLIIIFFAGFFIPLDVIDYQIPWLSDLSFTKYTNYGILHAIYAYGRCPPGQISLMLHKFNIDENQHWRMMGMLALICIGFRVFALLSLLIKVNFIDVQTVKKWINNRRIKPVTEIQRITSMA